MRDWLRVIPGLVLIAALALAGGCAVDPMEQLQQDIEAQDVAVRQRAVLALANLRDDRAIDALVDVLQGDEELCDLAGLAPAASPSTGRPGPVSAWRHAAPSRKS